MAWILVTPSSRGIGHALTRHLLTSTPPSIPIVATTRGSKSDLRSSLLHDLPLDPQHHSCLDIQHLDLLSEDSIAALATHCRETYHPPRSPNSKSNSSSTSDSLSMSDSPAHLRLGFFLPGQLLNPEKSPSAIDETSTLSTLSLNLVAPMLLIKHFHEFLPKKSQSQSLPPIPGLNPASITAVMSARVGSITDNALGGWYSYRASKAGLNQVVRTFDNYLKTRSGASRDGRAMCVGMHPGTVKTGLSKEFWGGVKEGKLFEPEYSAERLLGVLQGLEIERGRGRCWDWDGKEVPP